LLQRADERSIIANHLARYHQVIMPDLRGRGDTELPPGRCDLATIAADVAALIEHQNLTNVVLIGRNHGGAVGYTLAANRPDLVRGLVVGDTSPFISPERAAQRLEDLGNTPRTFPNLDVARAFYRDQLGVSDARADQDIPSDLVEVDGEYAWRHNLDHVERIERASAPREDWDLIASITVPILTLVGQRSAIRPETVKRLATANPRLRVQGISGSGPDVFLGPGAEQTRGAIDLFLMRLNTV
jgi:pimeloyl-ACP methyl ester carboxylesterase